ncbi:armadillo-type protein [Kockovaella imperatae]|uniref:Deoxyhypusine hydroxylase n=1 Tax=Kockovaella imperatae TaxID=4999 RepID=A0A1Y1UDL3_9TREE|nr:armadillo-type protein [Kockovaella imperatae]ORX35614.1 armadillo-type protein [Kockovaella imperatae]
MSVTVTADQLAALRAILLNSSGKTPLHERFRALFMLKAVGNDQVVNIISEGFEDDSSLMKHELAYVLGQLSNPLAIPKLEEVLVNDKQQHCSMVRHEAAEALGALSSESSLPLLRKYLDDPNREVRETCEVAIGKIQFDHGAEGKERMKNPDFPTIDPAPSSSREDIPALRAALLDTSRPLFERYRAMFALRDFGAASKDAVLSLAEGFGDSSALFRHEIAYVFGQLCSPHSIPSLLSRLEDAQEDPMVRHEAAEALGGIASDGIEGDEEASRVLPPGGVLQILREWAIKEGAPQVVKESCQIAIDMWEYENSQDQFNPLDTLVSKAHTTGMERSAASAVAAVAP